MGNLLNGNNQSGNTSIPYTEGKIDKPIQKAPMRPPPPKFYREQNRSGETDDMLERIDGQLTQWQASVRTMKGSKSKETRQELYKMMCDTERDLHIFNQQVQTSKSKGGGSDANLLQHVLIENDKNQEEIRSLRSKLSEEKRKVSNLQNKIAEQISDIASINEEKKDLQLRLSKVASAKLTDNNPAITDLNDRNRPTKLGEIYSELYDNEWTDAFEAFQKAKRTSEYAIETLYLTLLNVYDFCQSKSESLLRKTEDAVNFLFEEYTLLHQTHVSPKYMSMQVQRVLSRKSTCKFENALILYKRWRIQTQEHNMAMAKPLKVEKSSDIANHVKLLQKEVAESMAPVVQEAYMKANWIDREFIPQLEPFLRKCIFLCWMMVVQCPAMCFHQFEADTDVPFDKGMYREYTSSGEMVKYVVWPALLLHENGPLVSKGVAEGATLADKCQGSKK